MLRSYDRAMWLRRTRKGWAEPAPKRCANGHELRGGTVLVGTQHCDCGQIHPASAWILGERFQVRMLAGRSTRPADGDERFASFGPERCDDPRGARAT